MRSDLSTGFTGAEEATGLLNDVRSALSRLIHGEYWKLDGDALLDIGRSLEHLGRLLWAAQVHLTGEIHQQYLATTLGATNTAALLRETFRLTPGEASTRVRAAAALLPQDQPTGGETPTRRPALAAALDTGDITGAAVDAALRMFRRLPDTVPTEVLTAAEDHLVHHARTQDPPSTAASSTTSKPSCTPTDPTPTPTTPPCTTKWNYASDPATAPPA